MTRRRSISFVLAFALCAAGGALMTRGAVLAQAGTAAALQAAPAFPVPPSDSPAGPVAYSCGVPAAPSPPTGRGQPPPIFPPGQYPVSLPPMSLLGAPNDLPNPYQPGVDWGQLPPGRKWGSTASVTTAPDGTIWVIDR